MSDTRDSMVGRVVGPYRIERALGQGGMGSVYLARSSHADRVALKVLHKHLCGNRLHVERFRREAQAGTRLQHPAILRTLGTGEMADGHHYFTMEYFRGATVEDLLRRRGRFAESQALVVAYWVAGALEYAHRRGILHRDIKPANIMLNRAGDVRVADFGLAQVFGDAGPGDPGGFLGTPAYCPPEQLLGEEVDGRTDLYALGATTYEMLAGRPPFEGGTPLEVMERVLRQPATPLPEWRDDLMPETFDLVAELMERDRDQRTPFAVNAVDALEARLHACLNLGEGREAFEEALRREAEGAFLGTMEMDTGSAATAITDPGPVVPIQPTAPREEDVATLAMDAPVAPEEDEDTLDDVSSPSVPVPVWARHARAIVAGGALLFLLVGWATRLHARVAVPVLAHLLASERAAPVRIASVGIAALGPAAVPSLVARLDGAPAEQRRRLYAALRDLAAPEAGIALLAATTDGDPLVRSHAVAGLVAMAHPSAADISLAALKDPDPRVRATGLSGLPATPDPTYLPVLVQALVGADPSLRGRLVRVIPPYGAPALPLLREVWDPLDAQGRRSAAECAERIGDTEAVQWLIDRLDEPELAVRFFMVEALQRLTHQSIGDDPAAWRAWAAAERSPA